MDERSKSWASVRLASGRLAGLACLILLTSASILEAGEAIDRRMFLRDFSEAIGRVKNAAKHIYVEGELEHKNLKGAKAGQDPKGAVSSIIYARNGDHEMFDYSHDDEKDGYFHRIILKIPNNNYILRKHDSGDDMYLEYTEIPKSYNDYVAFRKRVVVDPAYLAYTTDIRTLLTTGGTIDAVEAVVKDGRKVDEVHFTAREKRTQKSGVLELITRGTLWLDPAIGFAIRDFQVELSQASEPSKTVKATGHIDYFDDPALPRPSNVVLETLHWHGQHALQAFRSKEWSYKEVPLANFTLEHFGLGDFANPRRGGRVGFIFWAFALAGVFLLAGIMLRYRSRRHADVPG